MAHLVNDKSTAAENLGTASLQRPHLLDLVDRRRKQCVCQARHLIGCQHRTVNLGSVVLRQPLIDR